MKETNVAVTNEYLNLIDVRKILVDLIMFKLLDNKHLYCRLSSEDEKLSDSIFYNPLFKIRHKSCVIL